MHSLGLPPFTITPSIITTVKKGKLHGSTLTTCKSSSNNYSSISDLNLYDLLGVDSSSNHGQIKLAYRALQKRCHPDIAGPSGHDMAIILNEAYALLSDPNSRVAYDKGHAKFADLQGYTGKPIYSSWFGSESETRGVFVDELKCIGCLKCALLAEKTFAIESVYGRARVIGQWADSEQKIQEAIDSCPVDCISFVKKSDLAALEFLMSKKPRGKVRIGTGNTVGERTSDVFQDLEKFQARFQSVTGKGSEISNLQRAAAAIQAIKNVSSWLYWWSPISGNTPHVHKNLTLISENSTEPDIQKLKNAAASRKQWTKKVSSPNTRNNEYWVPSPVVVEEAIAKNIKAKGSKHMEERKVDDEQFSIKESNERSRFFWVVPMATATVAAVIVRLQLGETASGDVKQHMGGSLALQVVNSNWLQVILAGVTWFLIGMAVMELIEATQNKLRKME